MLGSQPTGLFSVPTASDNPGGGGGGITEITSDDGSVTVTNPTGPIVDLSAPTSISKFSGIVFAPAEGSANSYLADAGHDDVNNQVDPYLYPSGPRKAIGLRVTCTFDSMDVDYLVSVYKSGTPDDGLTVTVPAGSSVRQFRVASEVDFTEGDSFDVGARPADTSPSPGGQLNLSATIEWK